jgi:formylglycine-generating enzyme required for sulfatase activity
MAALTWLHLSDLHACRPLSGWDSGRITETLVQDLAALQRDQGLRPDWIFFTGDAAFGHLDGKPLEEQFREAAAFLDAVRHAFTPEVPLRDLFLVPGNHDVDRREVLESQTEWLDRQSLDRVVKMIHGGGPEWRAVMRRLGPYLELLRAHDLGHLLADPQRALWAMVREIHGLRVGIAGFNSAWSCCRNGERGRLWAAGHWQQGTLREALRGADVSLALIHHPPGWLVEHEIPAFGRELRQDFKFLLHGHEHQDWVEPVAGGAFTTIAAGACYDRSDKENGYNLVRLDLETGRGEVFLRRYDRTGGGWVARPVHGSAPGGVWPLDLPWLRKLGKARPKSTPPPPSPSTASLEDPDLPHYLERLRAAHRDLPIAGFATRVRLPIRLESVYVPLRARLIHSVMESEHKKGGTFRDPVFAGEEDREVPFDAALALAREHGFRGAVVLGDPGTGKTTLLKHFVLAATDPTAGPRRLNLPPDTVPVLLELRRLADPAAGLRSALIGTVERVAPALDAAAFTARLLRRDHLLILVDGLDEIAEAGQRAEVSRWLEEAAAVSLPHSVFVVTSRFAGYKGDARLTGRFLELHVRDLTELEARRFLLDWYSAVEAQAELGRAPEVAAKLAAEGAEDLALRIFAADDPRTERLRDLATNPLLLQILCLVHRDRKRLPEQRVDLYGECCTVLLQLWREAKGMPVVLTAAQALKLLQPLAWWLHDQGRKEAGAAEILPLLAAPLRELGREPAEGEALLEAIRDQSGLLVNVGPAYAFLHLSFQEYLSARHVQDQVVRAPTLLTKLAGYFGKTWWREVILLAVGLDNPSLFEPLLSALLGQKALQRDVRLADDLLRDAAAVTPRPLLAALAAGIADPPERYHALRLLRAIPGWDAEGQTAVRPLLADPDPQVSAMAAELLGVERPAARRGRRGEPAAGEERLHEADGTILLYVPGGEYTLGAEDITDEEKPVHRVVLSPFWIAKYPVTNEQYGRFLAANRGTAEPQYWSDKRFNQPKQPVVGVSWEEAQAYCRWAGLRLPSEAQWEAAARGSDQRRYSWGNEEPTPELANFGNPEGATTPVGSYPKGRGPFGTLDQAGNVWEWCEDVWDAAAYREREGQRDPLSTTGETAARCLRGGSWYFDARNLPAACRNWIRASYRLRYIGFRCLSSAVPEP